MFCSTRAVTVFALGTIAASLQAQATSPAHAVKLTGTVLDTMQLPVSGANVELLGLGRLRTGDAGLFSFSGVPAGMVLLHVTRIGYRPLLKPIRLPDADSLDIDVTLQPAAYQLAPIVVREDSALNAFSDPTGFERRRRNSVGGHFITSADIERSRTFTTSQLLRTVPGVRVNGRGEVEIDRGAMTFIGPSCNAVTVIVDGVAIPSEQRAWGGDTGFSVDAIPVEFIRGVEVYAGPASTPVELRSSRTVCGTVVIWTKLGVQGRADTVPAGPRRPPEG